MILDTNSDAINNMYNDRAANANQSNGDMYFHIRPNTGGNYRPLTISLSNADYKIVSVTFTLKSSANGPVTVKMPDGTDYDCTTTSADQTITDYAVNDTKLIIAFEQTANIAIFSDVSVKVAKASRKDVTYNFFCGSTNIGSKVVTETVGAAPSFELPAYVTSSDMPATIDAAVDAYDVHTTYTSDLPFKLDGTKYNLKENRNPALWVFYDGSALKTIAGQVPTYENQDNYKWTFGGDWLNGFTVKNVAADKYVTYESVDPSDKDAVLTETLGDGAYFDLVQQSGKNYFKIHGTTVNAYMSNRGGAGKQELTHWNSTGNIGDAGSQLLFTEAEEISAPSFTFTPEEGKYYTLKVKDTELYVNLIDNSTDRKKDAILGTEPEGFRFTATTGGYHIQNADDLYIGGYTNDWNMSSATPEVWTIQNADDGIMLHCAQGNMGLDNVEEGMAFYRNKGGVVFIVEEYVAPEGVNWSALDAALSAAEGWNIGTGLGQYSAETSVNLTAVNTFVTTFKGHEELAELMGLSQEELQQQITDYATQINTMVAGLHLNLPKTGQFFRIKTSSSWISTPTYMKGTQGSHGGRNVVEFTQDADEIAGENTIFCYFHTNGDYLACYGNGMTAANNSTFMGINKYPATTAIAFQAATTGDKVGKYNIKFAGNRFLYTNQGLYGDAGSGNTAEGYNFELVEVTTLPVTFQAAGQGYATIYSPVALDIPAGVVAYYGTEESEGTVKVSPIEDGIIPANTAVVLFKEGVTETTTVDFTISDEAGTATSCFTGTVPAKASEEGTYVFSIAGEPAAPGFYSFGGTTLAGFKAYYVPETPSAVQGFVLDFGGQTVGIEGLQTAAPVKGAFDLQGRRVNAATRGLFIQNGVKVIR